MKQEKGFLNRHTVFPYQIRQGSPTTWGHVTTNPNLRYGQTTGLATDQKYLVCTILTGRFDAKDYRIELLGWLESSKMYEVLVYNQSERWPNNWKV